VYLAERAMADDESSDEDIDTGSLLLPKLQGPGPETAHPAPEPTESAAPADQSTPVEATAAPAAEPSEEGGENGPEADSGLPDASAAFVEDGEVELDPFRTARAAKTTPTPASAPAPKAGRPGGRFDFVRYEREHVANRKLFVRGLPFSATEAELLKFFSRFGKVQEVKLGQDRSSGRPRGFCFVTFAYHKGAKYCLDCGADKELGGRTVHCEVAAASDPSRQASRARPPPTTAAAAAQPPHGRATPTDRAVAAPRNRAQAPPSAATARSAPPPEDGPEADNPAKKRRREKIVTVTRREDAEPTKMSRISMRDLFPKEFWRV